MLGHTSHISRAQEPLMWRVATLLDGKLCNISPSHRTTLAQPQGPTRSGLHQGHSPQHTQDLSGPGTTPAGKGEKKKTNKKIGRKITLSWPSQFPTCNQLQMFLFFTALFLRPTPTFKYSSEHYQNGITNMAKFVEGIPSIFHVNQINRSSSKPPK